MYTIQYTSNSAVKHNKFFSIAQRNALNAQNIVRYTQAQQAQAQALAQALQALYFSKHVYVSYNAKSIAVKINAVVNSSALQHYIKQYNANVKYTQVSTILHLFSA